jgi:DNA-binding Lrp family transcriptional regulator
MKIDSLDVKLINMLQENARRSYTDLARATGVTIPTVKERIKRLIELGVIEGFTVMVNPDKIKNRSRSIILLETEPGKIEDITETLLGIDEICEVYQTAGSFDVALKVEVGNFAKLEKLISKLGNIPGVKGLKSSLIIRAHRELCIARMHEGDEIQFRCTFCHPVISEEPYVKVIEQQKHYFHSKECYKAYMAKISHAKRK